MKALEPWYVTGLAEGAGVFTYSRTGDTLNLVFALKRRAGDTELLSAVSAFFGGVGRVYGQQLRVTRLSDLSAVVRHFDAHPPRGRTRAVYDVWRQMVLLKSESYRKPPLDRLEELARELSRARQQADDQSGDD